MNKQLAGSRRESGSPHFIVESLEERRLLSAAVLDAIGNISVPAGKSYILPLTARDKLPLTYTVTSKSSDFTVQVHKNNPFLKLHIANFGDITIELLRDVAPRTVDRIRGLVEAGFYDGLTFHRVIPNFMIQGGDPSGNGSGGPGYSFDDEFNANAIFTGTGQLAMANSGDDTNGSQFFITTGAQRHLDFNHTIFGQVVRGQNVVEAITNTPRNGTNDKPITPVVITSAQIVQDTSDSVITVKAGPNASGKTGAITVKVSDGHGGVATRQFTVTGTTDTVDDPAFLGPIGDQHTPTNTPLTLHLSATDLDSNAIGYSMAVDSSSAANISISNHTVTQAATGTTPELWGPDITLTPTNGFTGIAYVQAKVYRASQTDPFDTQWITIVVGPQGITASAKPIATHAGIGSTLTLATFTVANPNASASDYKAVINWNNGTRTYGTISKSASRFLVKGTTPYLYSGVYPVDVDIYESAATPKAITTVHTTAKITPVSLISDLVQPSLKELLVNGTPQADSIKITPSSKGLLVRINGVLQGTYRPTGRILVIGGAGDDTISIDPRISVPAEIYGQEGNDKLIGGAGNDVLVGGDGNDTLSGMGATDLLMGSNGQDSLLGGDGDDVLIADLPQFQGFSTQEASILAEMASAQSYASRYKHLKGPTKGINLVILDSSTITKDTDADILLGGKGTDLYVYNGDTDVKDILSDRASGEKAIDV